jgi:hypothetical protein
LTGLAPVAAPAAAALGCAGWFGVGKCAVNRGGVAAGFLHRSHSIDSQLLATIDRRTIVSRLAATAVANEDTFAQPLQAKNLFRSVWGVGSPPSQSALGNGLSFIHGAAIGSSRGAIQAARRGVLVRPTQGAGAIGAHWHGAGVVVEGEGGAGLGAGGGVASREVP